MQIPKYWARAAVDEDGIEQKPATEQSWGFQGVGWSDLSEEDAYRHALERAKRIRERYDNDIEHFEDLREQYYTDRPLREPVIDEMHHGDRRIAVITQNIYGAYVLNAAEAMFIDIDVAPPPSQPGMIARVLGAKPTPPPQTTPLDDIHDTMHRHTDMGLKLYRTPNGYRGLVTHQPFTPGSNKANQLLDLFKADRLYARLCTAQQCFRARLTPKPWRIGMDNPPKTFPFTSPARQRVFDAWKAQYERRSASYAACEPVSDTPLGNPEVHPDIAPVLAMHDELACAPGKPLA